MNDNSNELILDKLNQVKESLMRTTVLFDELTALVNNNKTEVEPLADNEELLPKIDVTEWLRLRSIYLLPKNEPLPDYSKIDHVTKMLGDRYHLLSDLYANIKRSLSDDGRIQLKLDKATQDSISATTQICKLFHDFAFFTSFYYNRNRRIINANVSREGYIINYFTGSWFERYVFLKMDNMLAEIGAERSSLVNQQIILPNGDTYEIDLLWLINGQPLWIECKTGDYQNYITRYRRHKTWFKINRESFWLVILGLDQSVADGISSTHNINVVNESNFVLRIIDTLFPEWLGKISQKENG